MSQATLDGLDPPITQDPDYPELIRELASVVERQLVSIDIEPAHAAAVAEATAEAVREHFGGSPLYWAKGETMRQRRRRERMWSEFTGNNYAALARRYGICLQQAYRVIGVARREHAARVQGDMFAQDQAPPRA